MIGLDLVLASTSLRRIDLMRSLGYEFRTVDPRIDERVIVSPDAGVTAMSRAEAKALAVASREPGSVVLAADTVVVLDGRIMDKAHDEAEVMSMLEELSGREHQVITAIAVCYPGFKDANVETDVARVTFKELSEEEIEWYASTGEGVGKAGGYAVQGIGGSLVAELEGDPETVVGLSTTRVRGMLGG
jgi:septum formation protein